MKLSRHGKSTSRVELQAATPLGIWILIEKTEYFLPFEDFPWFKQAAIRDLEKIQLLHENHLHWPTLDIDLAVESLTNRQKFPLVARVSSSPKKTRQAA